MVKNAGLKCRVAAVKSLSVLHHNANYIFSGPLGSMSLFEDNFEDRLLSRCYGPMDGWVTCDFTSFSTVLQSYQVDRWMIMKGRVQWNLLYGLKDFHRERGSKPGLPV